MKVGNTSGPLDSSKVHEAPVSHALPETKKGAEIKSIGNDSLTSSTATANTTLIDDHAVKTTLEDKNKETSETVNNTVVPRLVEKNNIKAKKEEINKCKSRITNFKNEIDTLSKSQSKSTSESLRLTLLIKQLRNDVINLPKLEDQLKTMQQNTSYAPLTSAGATKKDEINESNLKIENLRNEITEQTKEQNTLSLSRSLSGEQNLRLTLLNKNLPLLKNRLAVEIESKVNLENQLKILKESKSLASNPELNKTNFETINKIFMEVVLGGLSEEIDPANLHAQISEEVGKENPNHTFEVHGRVFTVKTLSPTSFEIKEKSDFIAKGSFGEVFLVRNLGSEKLEAMKLASPKRPELREKANTDVFNEFEMLYHIEAKGKELGLDMSGIQVAPHTQITYIDGSGEIQKGHIGHFYNAGGATCLLTDELEEGEINYFNEDEDVAMEQTEHIIDKISAALNTLDILDIYHGDIKPGNLLVDINDLNGIDVVIGDFGGTTTFEKMGAKLLEMGQKYIDSNFKSELSLQELCGGELGTEAFASKKLLLAAQEQLELAQDLFKENPIDEAKILNHFNTNIKPLLKKNDAYAMGITEFTLLMKNSYLIIDPENGLRTYSKKIKEENSDPQLLKNTLEKYMKKELSYVTLERRETENEIIKKVLDGL